MSDHIVSIRAATVHDAVGIAHVHVESWRSTYAGIVPHAYLANLNEEERVPLWREWLTRDLHQLQVLAAELEGELVGFISGGPIRDPVRDCDAELFAMYLLQHAQGRGIGTALLHRLAAALRDQGFRGMAVWVLEKNPSRHFYVKSGAQLAASKDIEIGGAMLLELAYAWPDLEAIATAQ